MFALVTIGTGVGCGLIVNGELVTGATGVAGELGHLPVDPTGPACHCGGTGCVEVLIGEAALLDRITAVTRRPIHELADAIAAANASSGAPVRAVFDDMGRVLGRALASVANLLGPKRILLSGETLDAYDLFADTMQATFRAQCFGYALEHELIIQPLQFEHWARGAAAVAIAHLAQTAQLAPPHLRLASNISPIDGI